MAIRSRLLEADLPVGDRQTTDTQEIALAITRTGALLWNGQQVNRPELKARLALAAAGPEETVIRFEPDASTS
ncbi:hypothetical protein [Aurantiacibacter marinus]|uniref:Uncharacterized protein n=1 Tax=Aurantiacibacter marinus TaxID=874156 RepID=A0A0H0XS77_9SPHN|nr:hypothetical protein [Aurantiacibacter marinus]KLI64821.1 hypothetical protein AAV99_04740 [Aurantiacibacter marinus]